MATELSIAFPAPSLMVQVGVWMASDAVKLRVMSSPLLALPVPASAIDTEVNVGWVLSMVTLEPSVTAVTATPAVPPMSVKAIEKVIAPLASALLVSTTHVQVLPLGLDTATLLSIAFPAPSFIVHVGVWTSSDETIVSVTSSPSLAFPVPAVAIPTDVSVGAVVSRT